jgi:N-acyl homoserine lactone hydrolase
MPADELLTSSVMRLYVLDYGLFQVNENDRIIGIPGYLIQTHRGVNVLVDTGFPVWYVDDPARASYEDGLESFGRVLRLGPENLPSAQLARVGVSLGDIDWLIMTHSDIDHVGSINSFPDATIVMGRAERELDKPRYFGERSPIPWPNNASYLLVDQDTELIPGVVLMCTPGHSPGHLSLLLRLPETGTVLLAGDAISRPTELEEGFGGAWDEYQARSSAERIMAIGRRVGATILYGHDPVQWKTLRKAPEFYA